MFKGILVFFGILIVLVIALHRGLENGSVRDYLDRKNDPEWVPRAEYIIGQGYYLFHDLENAATFFIRVPERFPDSRYADFSYFYYVAAIDEANVRPRNEVADLYAKYIELYPQGQYRTLAENRLANIRSGAR